MKIVLTGGGSGGHFYPLIAVAEELNNLFQEKKLVTRELYLMSPDPYDKGFLHDNHITYIHIPAGKARRYFSLKNFIDVFVTGVGVITALIRLFIIYPDIVFSKGGYGSFPVLVAARILWIPVMIHESDSVPGRVNKWASKFAVRIGVSYQDASLYFPKEKTAYTGQPVRKKIKKPVTKGAREHFNIREADVPIILVLGGSQGARNINSVLLNTLPQLVENYYIIHQAGENNLTEVTEVSRVLLAESQYAHRYRPFASLSPDDLSFAAGIAKLVISRAGSAIFEIALWNIPSIIIPIADSNADHQRLNAFAYARSGAASVVEEQNLTASILIGEIERIMSSPERHKTMSEATKELVSPNAARVLAEGLMEIAESHT